MQDDTVLQRFKKFKAMVVAVDVPGNLLLEMVENYITPDDEDAPAEEVPVLEGQMSLFDYKFCT